MTNSIHVARKFTRNAFVILSGVAFLIFFAGMIGWKDEGVRAVLPQVSIFLASSIVFAYCARGLSVGRRWATHASLILTVAVVGPAILHPSILTSPVIGVFVLMIVTLPFVTYLEISEILSYRRSGRRVA